MKCCICGKDISTQKQPLDPWPLSYEDDEGCCQACYTLKVFPAIMEKQAYMNKHNLTDFIDVEEIKDVENS